MKYRVYPISSVPSNETGHVCPLRETGDLANPKYHLGGLKLEAKFNSGVGESMDLAILTNGTTIQCKGRALAIEDFKNKVHARLRFDCISAPEYKK